MGERKDRQGRLRSCLPQRMGSWDLREAGIKCGNCPNQAFVPVGDDFVRSHLQGRELANARRAEPFVGGVYPLLVDETCWFLAADFDKECWHRDALAFLTTCREKGVSAALERSRSGNGGHVWIFFSEPVPAIEARKLDACRRLREPDRIAPAIRTTTKRQ